MTKIHTIDSPAPWSPLGTRTGEVRPLSPPLYRHSNEKSTADVAPFAFVEATDPELLLLLASRELAGKPAWHFALARMANESLKVSCLGCPLWQADLLLERRRRPPRQTLLGLRRTVVRVSHNRFVPFQGRGR